MFENHLIVTTFNVLHDQRERAHRAELAGRQLAVTGPDIVLLQELPFERWQWEHGGNSSAYLDAMLDATGLNVAFAAPLTEYTFRDGRRGATSAGILHSERLKVLDSGEIPMHPDLIGFAPYPQSTYAVFEDWTGRAVIVLNLQGVWGGHNVHLREKQVAQADRFGAKLHDRLSAAGKDPLTVLGGDLNAEPDSTPLRYLKGLQPLEGAGTYWVDAWTAADGPDRAGMSLIMDNHWARETALGVGIADPSAVPDRRVDYLFVRGWAYGRRGNPVAAHLDVVGRDAQGRHSSDHLAVTAVLHPGVQALQDSISTHRRRAEVKAELELVTSGR